jgi:hypothetical protein
MPRMISSVKSMMRSTVSRYGTFTVSSRSGESDGIPVSADARKWIWWMRKGWTSRVACTAGGAPGHARIFAGNAEIVVGERHTVQCEDAGPDFPRTRRVIAMAQKENGMIASGRWK